jgi:hypothetical protein
MLRQIKQVLLTYLTHRYVLAVGLGIVGVVIAPSLLVMAFGHGSDASKAQYLTMVLGMPLLFAIPFLVGHVKTQFAHARSRLVPNFLPAHLLVLGSILAFLLVLYPLLLAVCCGLSAWGLIAIALVIATPAVWGNHLNRWSWTLGSVVAFYSLMTEWGMNWWILEAPEHLAVHVSIVVVGITALVAWMWRLAHLREEMNEYQRSMQWHSVRRSGSELVQDRQVIAQQVQRSTLGSWINDVYLARIGKYRPGGGMHVARLLRLGFSAQPMELQALVMAVMFLAISVFLISFSYLSKSGFGAQWFIVQMSLLMPGVWAGQMLVLRKPRIAMELMRPLTRGRYFDDLLAASAWNTVVAWLLLNASLAFAVLGLSSDPITLQIGVMFVVLSLAITWATFGLAVRTATWKSSVSRLAALIFGWMILAVPVLIWWFEHGAIGDWPFIGVAVLLLVIGGALIFSARRAWSNLEFA